MVTPPQPLTSLAIAGSRPSRAAAVALFADRLRVGDELVGDLALFLAPASTHGRLAALGDQRLVASEELLDLERIIGERLRRGIDRGQASADHDDRQADLQVGNGILLGRAGKLQRHQEIRRRTYAARETIGHVEHGGLARAGAQRNVIEAHREGVLDRNGAAETHTAKHRELRAPLEQQPHHLEVVLVPANGDAVFGDAAETRHRPIAEVLAQGGDVLHRREGDACSVRLDAGLRRRQRLDLQPVDADDRVAVVHQVMGKVEAGGTQPDDQHRAPRGGARDRAAQVERVPARQQRIDLEAPRQAEHVLQGAGLDLGNVDRFLLLVDAGFHAVVADAVPGRRQKRIVDRRDRQRTDREALALEEVHLRDLFLERAAREGHAER